MTKDKALKKIEELKAYVTKEEKNGYKILNTNGDVIYTSTKDNIRDAVIEAVNGGASLWGASLCGANLREANLREAELHEAIFCGKGGTQKLKKNQVTDFLNALGFQVEE